MTPQDKKVIAAFRRSGHAAPLRSLLERELAARRETNEGETASEANRQAVVAAKDVLDLLFGAQSA